jgi:hypothetical protein
MKLKADWSVKVNSITSDSYHDCDAHMDADGGKSPHSAQVVVLSGDGTFVLGQVCLSALPDFLQARDEYVFRRKERSKSHNF